jgi:hypothetical protein
MRELQLTRNPGDTRQLELAGVGTMRFGNRLGTKATIAAPGRGDWFMQRGLFRGPATAHDVAGATVAQVTGSGRVESAGRLLLATTPHQGLLERRPPFLLLEGEHELARVAPTVWSEKPLDVTILDEAFAERDPQLLLFTLYAANLVASARMASAAAAAAGRVP